MKLGSTKLCVRILQGYPINRVLTPGDQQIFLLKVTLILLLFIFLNLRHQLLCLDPHSVVIRWVGALRGLLKEGKADLILLKMIFHYS